MLGNWKQGYRVIPYFLPDVTKTVFTINKDDVFASNIK